MFSILIFLIVPIFSTIVLDGDTLVISDEGSISALQVSEYKDVARKCTITYDSLFKTTEEAFSGFSDLQSLTITAASIELTQYSFQGVPIGSIVLKATRSTITFGQNSLRQSNIESLEIESYGNIYFNTRSFQQCENMKTLKVISTTGYVSLSTPTFVQSDIENVNIQAQRSITFNTESFQQVTSIKEMHLSSQSDMIFSISAFDNCSIDTLFVESGGFPQFKEKSFEQIRIRNFTVVADRGISFEESAFNHSSIATVTVISKTEYISFGHHSFERCQNLTSLTAKAPDAISFFDFSFTLSDVEFVDISAYEGEENSKLLANSGTNIIGIKNGAFQLCSNLKTVSIKSDFVIEIEENAFSESSSLKTVTLTANSLTILERAFKDCESLEKVVINAKEQDIASNAYEGCNNLKPDEKDGLTGGQIAGIVIGVLVIVGIAAFCVYWFVFRNKSSKSNNEDAAEA